MEQSTPTIVSNLFIFTDWSDFYTKPADENYINKNSRLTGSQASYFVSFCQFINQTTNGAIGFSSTSTSTNFLVEDSLFSGCSNSAKGGSLCFEHDGQCIQNRVCSFKSKTNKGERGDYCLVDVSQLYPFQNEIIDSSITKSGLNTGRSSVYCINGAFSLLSTNISDAYTDSYQVDYIQDMNSDSFVHFSSFINNSQTPGSSSASVYTGSSSIPNVNIKNCNYLNNKDESNLLACSDIIVLFKNCNFENNLMKSQTCYHFNSGSTTFDQCYFDKIQSTDGTVIFSQMQNKKINLKLHQRSTFECEAEIPLLRYDKTPKIERKVIQLIPFYVNMTFLK